MTRATPFNLCELQDEVQNALAELTKNSAQMQKQLEDASARCQEMEEAGGRQRERLCSIEAQLRSDPRREGGENKALGPNNKRKAMAAFFAQMPCSEGDQTPQRQQ